MRRVEDGQSAGLATLRRQSHDESVVLLKNAGTRGRVEIVERLQAEEVWVCVCAGWV